LANGHKRQAHKRAEKRRRERRARRAQRAGRIATPVGRESSASGGKIVAAWGTPELAFAVSGRMAVALEVQGPGDSGALVYSHGSLLAGGYLGSMAKVIKDGFGRLAAGVREEVIPDLTLEPVTAAQAAMMMWPLFAWSVSRERIDPDEFDGPCLGLLPPPPGKPASWLSGFMARLPDGLVDVADAALASFDEWQGAPADRPDAEVEVKFALVTPRPVSLAAEIERNALEFGRTEDPLQFDWYEKPARGPLALRRGDPLGRVRLVPAGVEALIGSAEVAAQLALRLRELDPEVELSAASWQLFEEEAEELRLIGA
jgi:hypothetical protein